MKNCSQHTKNCAEHTHSTSQHLNTDRWIWRSEFTCTHITSDHSSRKRYSTVHTVTPGNHTTWWKQSIRESTCKNAWCHHTLL